MQVQTTFRSARYVQPISSQRLLRSPKALLLLPRQACHGSANVQQPFVPQRNLQLDQQSQRMMVCGRAASSDSSSSSSSSGPQQPRESRGGILSWFDRLPPNVQLGVMGGLVFIGMVVIPFLQPTFLYGDKTAAQHPITDVRQAKPDEFEKRQLPRYIPGASELYDLLQENAMPRKLPDGRSESPGVLRIYLSSMIILALFYACSAVVSLILRGVAGVLRAVGVMGPAPPPRPEGEDQQ